MRRGDDDRQPGREPVAGRAAEHVEDERLAGDDIEIERAVLAVGAEKPLKPEERREQRRDPKDRRADPGKQLQVRPDAEGHDRDHGEEEDEGDDRAAAGAKLKPKRLSGEREKARITRSLSVSEDQAAAPDASPRGSARLAQDAPP